MRSWGIELGNRGLDTAPTFGNERLPTGLPINRAADGTADKTVGSTVSRTVGSTGYFEGAICSMKLPHFSRIIFQV